MHKFLEQEWIEKMVQKNFTESELKAFVTQQHINLWNYYDLIFKT